jgi:hypothetical protein
VPYVLLTDSERGFQFFADNDQGWQVDETQPTHEVFKKDGKVYLRVNFILSPECPVRPATITYGWCVTPQKPQPSHWRGTELLTSPTYPEATAIFWCNADWAVVYPYYSSPFPWNYEKSRKKLDQRKRNGTIPAVGNIAHAIGRYQNYNGRNFNAVAGDWAPEPGRRTGRGDVARSRGPNDFQLWHFDKWIRESGLVALYFDETYLAEDFNYLTGGAYLRDDQQVQPGYCYIDQRAYFMRLRYMFAEHELERPNLWLHTTSGQAVYALAGDVIMEGENVAPRGGTNDYIEALPAGRLRSIGMGRNIGAAATQMCQAERHWKEGASHHLADQFIGWTLAHDILPGQLHAASHLISEMKLWRDSVTFLPYWKQQAVTATPDDVLVSAHSQPHETVLWVVNPTWEQVSAKLTVDLKALDLPARDLRVFDAETGEDIAMDAKGQLTVTLPPRMWRAVRLVEPKGLTDGQSFTLSFSKKTLAAEAAMGNPSALLPRFTHWEELVFVEGPDASPALALDRRTSVRFSARHHLAPEAGMVQARIKLADAKAHGTLLQVDDLCLLRDGAGKLVLQRISGKGTDNLAESDKVSLAVGEWQEVALRWTSAGTEALIDGKEVLRVKQTPTLDVRQRGLAIEHKRINRAGPPTFGVGPAANVIVDDLQCKGTME